FIIYLLVRFRFFAFRLFRVLKFVDIGPLAVLAALVVGMVFVPAIYSAEIVERENKVIGEVFDLSIDNITLFRGDWASYMEGSNYPVYAVTSFIVAGLGGIDFVTITGDGGGATITPTDTSVFEADYVIEVEALINLVVVNGRLLEVLGLTGYRDYFILFIPSDLYELFSALGHPIGYLAQFNGSNVSATICGLAFYLECFDYRTRLVIIDRYLPLWTLVEVDPGGASPSEILSLYRRPQVYMVVWEGSPVAGYLRGDPDSIVGLVNAAGINASGLLFIDYSSLRDRIREDLSLQRFSALSVIMLYLAFMFLMSLHIYFIKWREFQALNKKLFRSMGVSSGALLLWELLGLFLFLFILFTFLYLFNRISLSISADDPFFIAALALIGGAFSVLVAYSSVSARRRLQDVPGGVEGVVSG
ncbi:MAG: hypothetical protein F7C07_03330, partial [Desulfurococcales archaeon]|nr:hypothetical protein [Desulfurococcales archaeon]